MRLTLVTDAWHPQINGVVRTLGQIVRILGDRGHEVTVVTAAGRTTFGLPTYPEIRLAAVLPHGLDSEIAATRPQAVHIATEGPLGLAARSFCLRRNLPFTTGYHSRFPEMARARLPVPGTARACRALLRWFHGPSRAVMTPTPSMARILENARFRNVAVWTRGVDQARFRPMGGDAFPGLPRPVAVCAGRVAVEKGIEDFLDSPFPGSKVVVGDGPQRADLEARYPDVRFTGYLEGDDLTRAVSSADVFAFPSRTDTFGLVILEALACGVPVAAHDVPGPADILTDPGVGALDDDMGRALARALACDSRRCRSFALGFTWDESAARFESLLCPFSPDEAERASARAERMGILGHGQAARSGS